MSESQPDLYRVNGSRHRVAVVFGGTSSEHGVSCLTAAGVLSALDRDRFDVVGVGITRTGRWILVDSETISRLGVTDGRLPELSENAAEAMLMRVSSGSELAVREQSVLSHLGPVDVALALLHGPFGEDGTIQGLFEMMGTRYVGAGVLASAVGMDKHYIKLVLAASGLPIGPFVAITAAEWRRDRTACLATISALHYPLFVKPARGGSSLGITKVDEPAGLERGHRGRTCVRPQGHHRTRIRRRPRDSSAGCWMILMADSAGERSCRDPGAQRVGLLRLRRQVSARGAGRSRRAGRHADAELADQVQQLAIKTFEAIGCEGLARVDVFVTHDGHVVINEINTMPGFTPHSMFPRMWAASGVPYPELVERLITLALRRPVGLR